MCTYIGFGQFVKVVEETGGGVVDEHLGGVLGRHPAQDFLLGP